MCIRDSHHAVADLHQLFPELVQVRLGEVFGQVDDEELRAVAIGNVVDIVQGCLLYTSHLAADTGTIRGVLAIFEKYNVPIEHFPSGIDSFSLVVSTEKIKSCIYDIIGEIKDLFQPDSITVTDNIALIATCLLYTSRCV